MYSLKYTVVLYSFKPCRVGLVASVSASRTVGREFASRPGHTSLTVHPDCLKSRVVCGTVYGDMHLKISWDQT